MITKNKKLVRIILLTCVGVIVLFSTSIQTEAQTYNLVWINNVNASPNPMLYGQTTNLTINTGEYAQWFWLSTSTMVQPTVIIWIAGKPIIANMTSEQLSQLGFWGYMFFWWYNQAGTWTYEAQWDGRDVDGNLLLPGSYQAIVSVFAGAASTSSTATINIEFPRKIILTLDPTEITPEGRTWVSVTVLDTNNNNIPNYPVTIQAFASQYQSEPCDECGGHSHDSNRPIGNVLDSNGNSIGSIIQGTTGQNGESFRVRYGASKFGGIETIRAWDTQLPENYDEKKLTVRIPGLILLPEMVSFEKIGGTVLHKGPPQSTNVDNNHDGTSMTILSTQLITLAYHARVREVLLINDISLPFGGGFDIFGGWNQDIDSPGCRTRGHCEHRLGTNVDISGRGAKGRVTNENVFAQSVNLIRRGLGINIRYFYHRNHYHFTFGG